MVKIKFVLPSKEGLVAFCQIGTNVNVIRPPGYMFGPQSLILNGEKGSVKASIIASSVARKFECFAIILEPLYTKSVDRSEMDIIMKGSGTFHCLFRSEWEWKVSPDLVPPGWEPFNCRRGKFREIDRGALHACVSLIGFGLWSEEQTQTAFIIDDDDPMTFRLTTAPSEINELLAECDIVPVLQAPDWVASHSE